MTGRLALAAAVTAAAAVPLLGRDYYATLMLPFFGYSIALLGLNLLFGTTGLLSFGHALFLAVGGYTAAYLGSALGVRSLEAMLAVALVAAAVIAVPVGWLCVRYVRIYFGMLTLAFGMLFYSFLYKFYALTGGDEGMPVARPSLLGQG
ncbi:MAG TPA: branched-chain amino acid ABC transporter permease, partial [Pseudomonadales bacterium]|nr:branched-chain amino acid ABC transporter permease [Pseudomonadales bacterium]